MADEISPAAKGIRSRGWVLTVLGPLLSIAMAVLSVWLWRVINFKTLPGTTARWTGSHEMTVNAFCLFGTIFVFGLVCTVAGISMIRTGRRNIVFLVLIVLLAGVMIYFGNAIR